jgi:hypothetical protein
MFHGLDSKKSLYPTRQEKGVDERSDSATQRRKLGLGRRLADHDAI